MIFSRIADILFPPRCIFCGEKINSGYKCGSCKPENNVISHSLNVSMGKNSRMLTVYTPNKYFGEYRKTVLALKFHNKKYLAGSLGDYICDSMLICNYDVITFVPMTASKVRQRGYNQAELLADRISKNTGIKCQKLLNKTSDNKIQHTLSAKERKANVNGVFTCNGDIKGQRILVIDDIITTGATICECTKMLYKAGALKVEGICAADAHSAPSTKMD